MTMRAQSEFSTAQIGDALRILQERSRDYKNPETVPLRSPHRDTTQVSIGTVATFSPLDLDGDTLKLQCIGVRGSGSHRPFKPYKLIVDAIAEVTYAGDGLPDFALTHEFPRGWNEPDDGIYLTSWLHGDQIVVQVHGKRWPINGFSNKSLGSRFACAVIQPDEEISVNFEIEPLFLLVLNELRNIPPGYNQQPTNITVKFRAHMLGPTWVAPVKAVI